MITAGKQTGKTISVPKGLALSEIVSMGITLMLSFTLAKMLDAQNLSWEQAGYWIMIMLFTAAFSGAKVAAASIRRQKVFISVMSGILYWGSLLCVTALFFGGNYEAVPETGLIIMAGSGCAAMLSVPQWKKRGQRRIKR